MSSGDYVPCLCYFVSVCWNIFTAWTNLCAELLSLVLDSFSIISLNTWRNVCFHLLLSYSCHTPKEEEEEEKTTQVSSVELMNPHPVPSRADGHAAEGVTINIILLKRVLLYDDVSG